MASANRLEFKRLVELTASVGNDPLLTQASTGNTSIKIEGKLWIKASGRWMADAAHEDIFVAHDLEQLRNCLRQGIDPAAVFPDSSVETAMHAALPHKIAVHLHSVDVIAWAVRRDAVAELKPRLEGLSWQWIPYTSSGLPLARQIEHSARSGQDADVFILGNHGLIVAANELDRLEQVLDEVLTRLCLRARYTHPADYSVLAALSEDSHWDVPDDDDLHALATDRTSQALVTAGIMFPCQALCAKSSTPAPFLPVATNRVHEPIYANRPFIVVEQFGVLVNRSIGSAELAMLSGVVQVLRRLDGSSIVRYLTSDEIAGAAGQAVRYTELANQRRLKDHTHVLAGC